jgi:hypothetical protein
MPAGNSLDRIIPAAGKWMAAEQTPKGEAEAAHNPTLLHGFDRIL